MAKSSIKGLGPLLDRLKDAISRFDDKAYLALGEYVQKRIVQKARTGKRMYQGKDEKFPALKDSYKAARKRAQKTGKPSVDPTFFSPNRSNITLTGQYLKSLKLTKIDRQNRTIVIEPTGTRKDGMENQELAGCLAKMRRNVFGIDETGRKALKQMVLREIRKQIRNRVLRK